MIKKSVFPFKGKIRIISGLWRGKKLNVLNIPGLRPTADRMRETLFNWLNPVIRNARCLDCFAGSGALGFEALSRYARHVTLLDSHCMITAQLKKYVTLLNTHQVIIQNIDTLKWLLLPNKPYDIVFLDPPFRKGLLINTIMLLENNGWLTQDAFIYVEVEVENSIIDVPLNWNLYRKKSTGQVAYILYKRSLII
ncbi:Ribosomal RNA small subunit methyltransferase D [Candidatus Profftia lariciata]|uniref:16S rRNA (guanine(966)-N(2))-methyltransferase RsmD n=1 Tax=Candidatus Profftia lariciata TaxID=1987921 RepID=UPI001D0227F6|nr:16S rRNA (guanine(966)-N(2))-methyltransferase RsmD [Candidatus Profftia lariciata]UDG81757.1 Ribosomal RNA small subunit methyltransferase D [Candidatus Profftia lariciata]